MSEENFKKKVAYNGLKSKMYCTNCVLGACKGRVLSVHWACLCFAQIMCWVDMNLSHIRESKKVADMVAYIESDIKIGV